MKTVGIVPIKEHSARVPGKNFRLIAGVPLWMYPVAALAESGVIDEIVIDTDCSDRFGVVKTLVPLSIESRDPAVRGDDVSMNIVIASVMERHPADRYVQLHATSPFVKPGSIRSAFSLLDDYDSVCSVSVHQSRFWSAGNKAINHNPNELIPTQDLAPLFEENSAFYMFGREAFVETGRRVCGRKADYCVTPIEAIDIDDEGDFELAALIGLGKKTAHEKRLDLSGRV